MKATFDKVIQHTNELNLLIEDMLNIIPNTAKNFKLKKKFESAYRTLKRSMEAHHAIISDVVPPIKNNKSSFPPEFIETWNIYKDYMVEQFGIRMGSRMQLFRLQLLFEYTNNDFKLAAKWLKYYMASGSSNIYPVNEVKIQEQKNKNDDKKAGFTLPTTTN